MQNINIKKVSLIIIIVGTLGYGIYQLVTLIKNYQLANVEIAQNKATIEGLEQKIAEIENENLGLNENLTKEQKAKEALDRQNRIISRENDTLTKLTTYDPELLKKYSKVYFLNENYSPPELSVIDPKWLTKTDKEYQFLEKTYPFLEDLLEDANDDGIPLRIASAYRSFGEQSSLKAQYTFVYGSGTANQFSADQGYSEHQLGTTVDFTTPTIVGAYPAFGNDPAFKWLKENAYKHGFILSYPAGNKYYEYEPWHWRFVGKDLAEDLHDDGKDFYEMDQRELDDYLIKIFDK